MNTHLISHLVIGIFLLSSVSCTVSEIKETDGPKAPGSQEPGDCISCHDNKEVIPKDHIDTRGMMGDDCGGCHESDPTSLGKKIPLSHIHQLAGVSCKGCHEDPDSDKTAGTEVCKKCHDDMNALYEATSEEVINPHLSPHEGKTPDCNRCHHQHKNSENFCYNCHSR